MSSFDNVNRLILPDEIKQEPEIKEEPITDGDLVEFPAIFGDGFGQAWNNQGQHNGSCDIGIVPLNEVKSEVRQQRFTKKKKNQATRDYTRQKPTSEDRATHNAKKASKSGAQGNSSKLHRCDQCDYATKFEYNLKRHLLTHTGKKPFPCSHCTEKFTRKQYLQNHMKVHVKDFIFNCAVCLQGFTDKKEKLDHEWACSFRRYECHLCKYSFGSRKGNLINHIRTHSGSKPFECSKCSKKFTTKNNLTGHMMHHFVGRSKCRRGFAQQDEMIAHEQKCSLRVYVCYICGKFIGIRKKSLTDHMRTHTGDKPFQCTQCSKKFTAKSGLNKHIKIHSRKLPWKCAICRNGFASETQLKVHQRKGCKRRCYECCLCGNFFGFWKGNLQRHMLTHTGEKSFQCKICCSKFARKSCFNMHINHVHNKNY